MARRADPAVGDDVVGGLGAERSRDPGRLPAPQLWDGVAAQPDALPDGWRRHARRAHLELVERWVGRPRGRWLKTDLFEERLDQRSLVDRLDTAAWIGTDVSADVARAARRACPAAVNDVRALGLATASLDGVLSTSTLDHFDDVADIDVALEEIHRVLRPGAPLVLTLDNPRNPLVRARNALPHRLAVRTGLVPFPVGRTLDADEGSAALREAGFDVEAVEHVLHAPHVVGTRLASRRWWERRALPAIDRLGGTRLGDRTGHFVAFLARAR